MYNRESETNAEAHALHMVNLQKQATARLKKVAELDKLKKSQSKSDATHQ